MIDGRKLPKITNEIKYSVDNSGQNDDNYNKVSEKIFDEYLNDGIKKMVADTVANEISNHVDLSQMSDPVARDEARDKLPYIRDMLVKYNQLITRTDKPEYKNRLAVKIEYARRCFDNDSRIRNEALRSMDGDSEQRRIHQTDNETVSRG
ncbi:MAG: hypothetical protein IJ728_13330, partial [Selenomonadaceae bacterium]|nr:hypothetical protein [Selenomonadaceae bacterium]